MLKVENLSKQFAGNDFYSLKEVSLELKKGEIVGLIGKNGAGKSTLMKLLAKSLRPTSGRITYKGVDINSRDNILDDFGIMIDPVFYPDMSVLDNLTFYLNLHGKQDLLPNIEKTLKLVELWEVRHRKPRGFSFGMKQRTALAIAMVAEPDVLILDEPFVGLDPIGVQGLIDKLKSWSQERQISILISSHQLGELEALCERYLYIEGGELADSFVGQGGAQVILQLSDDIDVQRLEPFLGEQLILKDKEITVSTEVSPDLLNALLGLLGQAGWIRRIEVKESQLKDVFMKG